MTIEPHTSTTRLDSTRLDSTRLAVCVLTDDDDDDDVVLVHDASVAGDHDDAGGDRWTTGEDNDADARGARRRDASSLDAPRTTPSADARG